MGYTQPSPVQEAAIGPMLDSQDLLVQAPTGTGKTAAFGIPSVEHVDRASRHIQTVILCPTRELAVQTARVLKQLASFKPGVRILALYGGEPISRQISALRRRPQIIVATPGRLIDHIQRRTTRLNHVQSVILDEADRMLDMGFREDIDTILQGMPDQRQTVLFSATIPDGIKKIAAEYQQDAGHIAIQQETLTVEKIQQFYCEVRRDKTPVLLELLREKQFGLSLIFVATKVMAETLARQLSDAGFPADSLHGDLRQSQRDKVMERYRNGKVSILVATDVAARGIDVNQIDAVINYDIPGDCESYIHRIGRTGRADQEGCAYTLIYPRERSKLQGMMQTTKAPILPISLTTAEKQREGALEPAYTATKKSKKGRWAQKKRRNSGGGRTRTGTARYASHMTNT